MVSCAQDLKKLDPEAGGDMGLRVEGWGLGIGRY